MAGHYACLGVLAIICLMPIWVMLATSLKDEITIFERTTSMPTFRGPLRVNRTGEPHRVLRKPFCLCHAAKAVCSLAVETAIGLSVEQVIGFTGLRLVDSRRSRFPIPSGVIRWHWTKLHYLFE